MSWNLAYGKYQKQSFIFLEDSFSLDFLIHSTNIYRAPTMYRLGAMHLFAIRWQIPWGHKREWVKVTQSCLTLFDPMNCSSSVCGILQAKSIGVGYHFLLWGLFLTQGSNLEPESLVLQTDSLPLSHWGSPGHKQLMLFCYTWYLMSELKPCHSLKNQQRMLTLFFEGIKVFHRYKECWGRKELKYYHSHHFEEK